MDIGARPGAVYRAATVHDLTDIAALELEQFADHAYPYTALRQLFDLHGSHWVVAELDDRVCGYALVGLGSRSRGWVMGLAVATQYRGRRIGRGLLERAVHSCRTAAADSVYITVRPSDQLATNLYKTAGFEVTGHEDQYFGPGEPRDVLRYRLTPKPTAGRVPEPADPHWLKQRPGR
ncbi:GNAT family N-acetyltransferase [Nocardia sp. NPDC050713]|uniref:GNAT family N-acetyltransferase n=1 Tax=unclassified Nocardia TaxID=2637762 RepID=UPI0033B8FBE3